MPPPQMTGLNILATNIPLDAYTAAAAREAAAAAAVAAWTDGAKVKASTLQGSCVSGPADRWKLENYDTDDLIGKIFLFFEAQESGTLRPGHRVTWRGDSYVHDATDDGIDLTGGYHDAGAFAAASLALKQDPLQEDLAEKCRQHATVTYEEAIQHPGIYSDSIPECQKTYQNDNWEQYAYFAAAWRYEISGDENHLQDAKSWQQKAASKSMHPDYSWQAVYFGATALLWSRTLDPCFGDKLDFFARSHLNCENGIKRTPCGMTFVCEWGSCRHAAGAAAVLALYARGLLKANADDENAVKIMEFAKHQICYILGACGHSWVIGYGRRPPQRPHHRDSALHMHQSGDWEAWQQNDANPNPIVGGLCGGPLADGFWKDDRDDYKGNEGFPSINAAKYNSLYVNSSS